MNKINIQYTLLTKEQNSRNNEFKEVIEENNDLKQELKDKQKIKADYERSKAIYDKIKIAYDDAELEIENLNNYNKFHLKEKNLIIDSLRKLVYNHNQLNETSSFESDIEIQKMDFVNARNTIHLIIIY